MTEDDDGSVTHLIYDLRSGPSDATTRALWERYFHRLSNYARARLRSSINGSMDGEDIALSVIESFFRATAAGRFPNLTDRDQLWRLLVTMTNRKAYNHNRDAARLKRGGGKVVAAAALGNGTDSEAFFAQIVSDEPTPERAAMVTDEYRRLFGNLGDDSLQVIALLKLELFTNEEIARTMNTSLRTIERKLKEIRECWMTEAEA